MQIHANFLRVLFLLSTIVIVTDCCSSRILLLKEHTLKIVFQQKLQRLHWHEQRAALAQRQRTQPAQQQKIPQQVELATQTNFGKTSNASDDDPNNSYNMLQFTSNDTSDELTTLATAPITTTPPALYDSPPNTTTAKVDLPERGSKFHVIDFYYTIMRDVLSFECYGQYLTDFCLNRGRCFRYPVGNHSFFSCECADGFVGERCESKSLNEYYVPPPVNDPSRKPTVLMARIFFSFPILIAISIIHIIFGIMVVLRCPKQSQSMDNATLAHVSNDDAATLTAIIG